MPREKKQHLKRRADGRFACRYKDRWFMADTEEEALRARDEYKQLERQGMAAAAAPVTVRTYAARWLPVHKRGVSTNTYNAYAHHVDVLCDAIGDMRLDAVRPSDINAAYAYYDGQSRSSIRCARMIFVAIFDTAVEDGYIRSNPCRAKHAQPPEGSSGSHRAITDEERQLIHQTPHRLRLMALVMLYAGLRRGEALAIDIDRDVDYINHMIHVREAVRFENNVSVVTDPKTAAGTRDVPLLSVLERELRGHHGLLAPSSSGAIMTESAFTRAWESYVTNQEHALNGVNIKRGVDASAWREFTVRPHDLRHSYCTMLRDSGVDLKVAMQWMGHADEKMILRIYDHITDYRTRQAVGAVESLIGRQNGRQDDEMERISRMA